MLNRRFFGLTTAGLLAAPLCKQQTSQFDAAPNLNPFTYGQAAKLDCHSDNVEWNGGFVQLLRFSSLSFSLDPDTNQVSAIAKGRLITFDDVEYLLSLALFDKEGAFLGAATKTCQVQRIWLGVYASQGISIEFDFKSSSRYPAADRFAFSISSEKVLTPSDWQK